MAAQKNMQVLRFWRDRPPETPVDVFVAEPFDFAREFANADVCESAPGIPVRIVSLETLLEMNLAAGRPEGGPGGH